MPIPWLIVLQNIPWRQVIINAPRVADEAKKLWTSLSRPKSEFEHHTPYAKSSDKFEVKILRDPDVLASKVLTLEAMTHDLHQQMLESTKIINTLAEQNTQLVNHIEKNRKRIQQLSWAFLILLIAFAVFVARYSH